MGRYNPLKPNNLSNPARFQMMQEELEKENLINQIVRDYEAGVNVNSDSYCAAVGLSDYPLSERNEIIKEVNRRIR
jgi:hypothetical protein